MLTDKLLTILLTSRIYKNEWNSQLNQHFSNIQDSLFGVRYEKKRVVIDIRGFNKITVIDFYPMPLQSDIIAVITGCQYISVLDAAGFLYQWLVRLIDRH